MRTVAFGLCLVALCVLTGAPQVDRKERLWRLLFSPPRFQSLSATVEVQVFTGPPGQVWTARLWADQSNHRTDLTFPLPTGARPVSLISRPDGVWVLLPHIKRIARHEPGPGPWQPLWGIKTTKEPLAKQNYWVRFSGKDRNDPAIIILDLVPRHSGNPLRKIHFHAPFRVPLRIERFSPDGKLEMSVSLKDPRFDEPLPAGIFDVTVPEGWQVEKKEAPAFPVDLKEAEARLGFVPLVPSWLPPGYAFDALFVGKGRHRQVAHLLYTDGITVISVFEHPSFGPGHGHRWKRPRPPGMMPIRMTKRQVAGLDVVIVSDVDQSWLEKMADSLVPLTVRGR
ncbi:MAG: hypothetical protein NZ959_02240 [Armatimonadetes bacterium]|nr:hypothetical protein [Armatimonadota bacterium]MDW8121006.1 hypothetical protein [Armatimonadota bacterium]